MDEKDSQYANGQNKDFVDQMGLDKCKMRETQG